MKVMKFGGTSVGSVNSILNLKNIVEEAAKHEQVIVVVSALGGVTDKLIKISKMAVAQIQHLQAEILALLLKLNLILKQVRKLNLMYSLVLL